MIFNEKIKRMRIIALVILHLSSNAMVKNGTITDGSTFFLFMYESACTCYSLILQYTYLNFDIALRMRIMLVIIGILKPHELHTTVQNRGKGATVHVLFHHLLEKFCKFMLLIYQSVYMLVYTD